MRDIYSISIVVLQMNQCFALLQLTPPCGGRTHGVLSSPGVWQSPTHAPRGGERIFFSNSYEPSTLQLTSERFEHGFLSVRPGALDFNSRHPGGRTVPSDSRTRHLTSLQLPPPCGGRAGIFHQSTHFGKWHFNSRPRMGCTLVTIYYLCWI